MELAPNPHYSGLGET